MKSRARTVHSKETAQTRSKSLLERHALDRDYRFITGTLSQIYCFSGVQSLCSRRAVFSPRGFCPFDTHSIASPMGRMGRS